MYCRLYLTSIKESTPVDEYLHWIWMFLESSKIDVLTSNGKKQREGRTSIFNVHSLVTDLKSCSIRRDLQWGIRLHAKVVESRLQSNTYVLTALVRMYAKCGNMVEARLIFNSILKLDVVSWNVLLLGYAENRKGVTVLEMFSKMKEYGYTPDSVTYVAALKACTSLAVNADMQKGEWLERGRKIHSEIGHYLDPYLQSTLIGMYAKCGSMVDARRVFDSIQKPDVVCWNILLKGFVENGEGLTALEFFSKMKAVRGCAPDSATYVAALKACASLAVNGDRSKMLEQGRDIHLEISCRLNLYMQNALIDMYAKCGSMVDARGVFHGIQSPDVVSWTALILGYVENREELVALDLFSTMKACGCVPDSVTYVAALKACSSLAVNGNDNGAGDWLKRGKEVHSEIGFCHLDRHVQSTLIDMYAKCGSMMEARLVFDNIQNPDVVSWNSLIVGYVENGEARNALDLFSRVKDSHQCAPNSVTYVAAFKACTSLAVNGDDIGFERGTEIHLEINDRLLDHCMQNTLIDMYAKCRCMVDARCVFDSIQSPDVVSWTALLLGYVENEEGLTAIELFLQMRARGCAPNSVTYIAAIKACGLTGALDLGRTFHLEIGDFSARLVTCLVDFYAKCGSMAEAREVFDLHFSAREVPTWNVLLAGYGSFGDIGSVFKLFEAMQEQRVQPDAVTFVCILSCCSHAGLVQKAREYFEAMPKQYGVIPTVMHFTCMIDLLGRANQLNEAIAVLQEMPYKPDAVTLKTLLGACQKWKNVEIGTWVFRYLVQIDKHNASAYAVMAHIYGSQGMWEEQERVLETKLRCQVPPPLLNGMKL